MQKISYGLILTLILISISCSDNSSINSPLRSEKVKIINTFGDGTISVSKIIDGTIGGVITADTTIVDLSGNLVIVHARLKFDPLSFEGVREITMTPDVNTASIQFFPEMKFQIPVKLQLEYTNIDLIRLGFTANSIVKFVFIRESLKMSTQYEPVDYSFCQINWSQQSLRVSNAKLSHFSRYAFIR